MENITRHYGIIYISLFILLEFHSWTNEFIYIEIRLSYGNTFALLKKCDYRRKKCIENWSNHVTQQS